MSRGWARGQTRLGRQIAKMVIDRDGGVCQLQLEGCTYTRNLEAHHLDGKAAGDNPARMVAACQSCNGKVGDPTRHDPPAQPLTRW